MFMPRTALTHALRGRGKALAAGLGVAAALAGAGSASAALTSGPVSATHLSAPAHAAELTSHHVSATPVRITPTSSVTQASSGNPAPAHAATGAVVSEPTQAPSGSPAPAQAATGAVVPVPAKPAAAQPAPAQSQPAAAQPAAAPAAQPAQPAAAPAAQPAQQTQQQQEQQQPVTQPASGPYQIYDSTTPSSIPAGQQAAVYANGTYAASPSQLAGHANTIWIDTNGSDPHANALDVEPGDATPQQAGQWVAQKLTETPNQVAIVYTFRSDWPAVQAAVGQLPQWMQSHVRWWIADPTGVPHMVPGASATQWYWGANYDISTANPGF
jgi:hypothetical protein